MKHYKALMMGVAIEAASADERVYFKSQPEQVAALMMTKEPFKERSIGREKSWFVVKKGEQDIREEIKGFFDNLKQLGFEVKEWETQ